MVTVKIDVSPHTKTVLEHIKEFDGHLTMDSVIRSLLKTNRFDEGDANANTLST